MLQNFQQQPVKPEINTQPPVHAIHTHAQNVTAGMGMVPPQPPLPTQPTQQKTAFDKVTVCFYICDQQLNVLIIFLRVIQCWRNQNTLLKMIHLI